MLYTGFLKYLKKSPGQGILYSNHGHLVAEAYTDADWVGSNKIEDQKQVIVQW